METLRRSSVLAPVVLLCVLALGACGQSSPRPVRSLSATAATGVTPPKTVTAHRLRPAASGGLRPGTPMSSSFTGIRGFTNRRDGFAITEIFKASDGTYPVATTDGGKTWRGRTGPAQSWLPRARLPLARQASPCRGSTSPWCGACNSSEVST
jgi:hypothetical protein